MENLVPNVLPPILLCAALLAAPLPGEARMDALPLLAQADKDEAANGRHRAAERAAAETGGKVLSSEPDTLEGRPVYRVKVLTPDGHVRTVIIEDGAR